MKIKHTLTRDWKTISGRITETIFEEWRDKNDYIGRQTDDWEFKIISDAYPKLWYDELYVWGSFYGEEDRKISFTYKTEEKAKQIMKRINEFTVSDEPKFKEGDWVYVRNYDDQEWKKRMYIETLPKGRKKKYIVVREDDLYNYESWCDYIVSTWQQIKPYKGTIKIKTEDGETIEIEREKAKSLWFKLNKQWNTQQQ